MTSVRTRLLDRRRTDPRWRFGAASVALHVGAALAAALFARATPLAAGGAPVVHVSLVSGAGQANGRAAAAQTDVLASQLEQLSEAAVPRNTTAATSSSPTEASLDDPMPAKTGGGGASSGQGNAGGAPVAAPYACASLSGDAGLSAATELHDQVMACWLGERGGAPIFLRLVLRPDGTQRRPPSVVRSARPRHIPFETAAVRAASECAPYRLSTPLSGVFEIAVG